MRRFDIHPRHDLGQNFLIDSNLLAVIAREARLTTDDVVLEVGGGVGALSGYLPPLVAKLHVIEVDTSLEAALKDAVVPFDNVTLHWTDAVRMDLTALDPMPNKVVANLPYGIAAAMILRTIEELPSVTRWVVMVQREVGERLAAAPGGGVYGASSILAQLVADVRVVRQISRTVFSPVPRVDSVLLAIDRVRPAPSIGLRRLVKAAFAHRRKPLAGSLALAGQNVAGDGSTGAKAHTRQRVRVALEAIGVAPGARAQELSPDQFRALGEALGI